MRKMKIYTLITLLTLFSCLAQAEGAQAELEIRQRDVVIEEMAELIFYSFKGQSKEELIKFLRSHPKAVENPHIVGVESGYVFWGATIKFKYQNGILTNVYW